MNLESVDSVIDLYRESFPAFSGMVRRMGGSLEEAKDCFHDALLVYLEREKAGKLQIQSSPKAYLLGIAKICWLHSRKNGTTLSLSEGFEAAITEDHDAEEIETKLMESLQKSGKKCLELLKAFYYDHASMAHIAGLFGFSGQRSATVQKYKCLEKIRNEMKNKEIYAQ